MRHKTEAETMLQDLLVNCVETANTDDLIQLAAWVTKQCDQKDCSLCNTLKKLVFELETGIKS